MIKKHGVNANPLVFTDLFRLAGENVTCIVDAGAHSGSFTNTFKLKYPGAAIHAFEPIPYLANSIRNMFGGPNVTVYSYALGMYSAQNVRLGVTKKKGATSILLPSSNLKKYHGNGVDIVETFNVDVIALDSLKLPPLDIFKLDIQGSELIALEGAVETLKTTRIILCEVQFIPLYDNAPLMKDIWEMLNNMGFRLYNLYELWTQQSDGQLTAGDAIFIKE